MTKPADTLTIDGKIYKFDGTAPDKGKGKGKGKGKDGGDGKGGGKGTATGPPIGVAVGDDLVGGKAGKGGKGKARRRRSRSRFAVPAAQPAIDAPRLAAAAQPTWAKDLGPPLPADANGRIRYPFGDKRGKFALADLVEVVVLPA